MNWNALAAWLYLNDEVDWAKADRYGVQVIYFDPRSGNAPHVRDEILAHGRLPGIYTVPNWCPGLSGSQFALWTSQQLQRLLPRTGAEAPPYMADLEAVSIDWQRAFLQTYRSYQPRRPSSYTNEPFKDGTVVPVPELAAAGFHWYPQTYCGDMHAADAAAVVLEVARWGFPADRIHPFYAGERLPADHRDGCVFTLERLP